MTEGKRPWILIPAYQPDERLVDAVHALRQMGYDVIVVDDGSDARCAFLFDEVAATGAAVVTHDRNRGKGAALKTGLRWAIERDPSRGVVTADADGQHLPADIDAVARQLDTCPSTLVIGGRHLGADAPLRSRVGNALSRWAFRGMTGMKVHDTQSGLRGLPASRLPELAALAGERYDYEMNVLLVCARGKLDVCEIPIETVYLDGNRGSHFRGLTDAAWVFARLLRFVASSAMAFGIDMGLYYLLLALGWRVASAYAGARVVSACANFAMNKAVVFSHAGNWLKTALQYAALALCILIAGSYACTWLVRWGWHPVMAKVVVDVSLFAASFAVQHAWIFRLSDEAGRDRLS